MSEKPTTTATTNAEVKVLTSQDVEMAKITASKAMANIGGDTFSSVAAFQHWYRVAELFASSAFVPKHFQNKPADCLIGLNMANRMQEDPLMVLQSLYVVHGRPGFATSFMIARANKSGVFKSSIKWTVERVENPDKLKGIPNLVVTAFATDRHGDIVDATVSTEMAVAEGWDSNAKYRTMGELMLRYRSAAMLIRLYAPEVMFGHTVEEIETMPQEDSNGGTIPSFASPPKFTPSAILGTASQVIDAEVVETPAVAEKPAEKPVEKSAETPPPSTAQADPPNPITGDSVIPSGHPDAPPPPTAGKGSKPLFG